MDNTPLVVAYGGGVDSTAMLVGMKDRGIMPDLILMANTGGELPETLRWLSVFAAWLRDNGMPALQIVKTLRIPDTLEAQCLSKAMLPSLAYGGLKQCSSDFKRDPQNRFVNHWNPAKAAWANGYRIAKTIGYDADEAHRSIKDCKKYHYIYPLVEWCLGRDDCVRLILDEGLPLPPKSACYFCPARKKHEVLMLKRKHPDLFARAVAIERTAREAGNLHITKGLGRRWSWEALGKADDAQMSLDGFLETDDEPCGCFDGDYDGIDESVIELSVSAGCKAPSNHKHNVGVGEMGGENEEAKHAAATD